MSLLELLLVVQTAVPGDTVPPYLAFPEPGLDDPAAYEGYETRVYRDASGNAFQIYLNRSQGRVVHLWADALNESAGFTARDSAGAPAELAWSSGSAVVGASGRTRSVSYGLEAPSSITLGLLLLGSMRVERDFQYARRDSLPLDATPFPQPELSQLIDHIAKLPGAERARHLALLGVKTPGALRARLLPRITEQHGDTAWVVRVEQVSFDGKTHLWLALEGDARETVAAVRGGTVRIRRPAGGVVRFGVRVTTDAPALTPLSRAEIFNDDFRRFSETVRGDSAHPDRFRRLEREVRGMELLCSREKLMAGLPNFATYFGRDMLMTALLMEPVWAPAMPEHVIASALRKLSAAGAGRAQAHVSAGGAPPPAARHQSRVRDAASSGVHPQSGGDQAGQLSPGSRRPLDLRELARLPGRVRRRSVRHGCERHLGAARARGRGNDPGCPAAARPDAGHSRRAAGRLPTRSRGARARDCRVARRRAPLPGRRRRRRPSGRGPAALAAAGGAGVLGGRHPADRIPRGYAAVSRPLARRERSADPDRQHRPRHAAPARAGRAGSDARARGPDHAAVPVGVVRRRSGSPGGQRHLRVARRVGAVSSGPLSFADRRVGAGRQCATRRPREADRDGDRLVPRRRGAIT